jgi:hypothetical protein
LFEVQEQQKQFMMIEVKLVAKKGKKKRMACYHKGSTLLFLGSLVLGQANVML